MRTIAAVAALLCAACTVWPIDPTPRSISIASWNLEHLAELNDSGCRPRRDADYEALSAHFEQARPAIVGFQEVENEAAAYRVFDPSDYVVILEARPGGAGRPPCRGFEGRRLNRQSVGFAIRRDIPFVRHPDVSVIALGDPNLRTGVDITVTPPGRDPIRLLAVHLKSGCAAGDAGEAYATLFQQVPIVERWIDARAQEGIDFAVLGDFNRRLAAPSDRVWSDWDDGSPPQADLSLAAGPSPARCDPRYPAFIDHIVLSAGASERLLRFLEVTYPKDRLSDHCLIVAEMR